MSSTGKIMLRELEVENFLSHVKTRIVFEPGVTALVGRTGAGKSSIIDAIYFALRGESRRGTLTNLINDRASKTRVRLRLSIGSLEITVERTLRKERGGRTSHEARLMENNRYTAQGAHSVSRRIAELLGVPARSIDKVMIIAQGEVTRLLTEERSERMRILDHVLGISSYEEAYNQLRELDIPVSLEGLGVTKHFTISARSMPGQVSEAREEVRRKLAETRSNLRKIAGEKERIKRSIAEHEELLGKLKPRLRQAEELYRRLEELHSRYREIEGKIEVYGKRLSEILGEKKELEKRLSEINRLLEEVENLKPYAEARESLEKLASLIKEKNDLGRLKQQMRARLEDVMQALETMRRLEEKYEGRIEELASMARELEEESRRLEEEEKNWREQASRLEERLRAISEDKEKLEAYKSQVLREALLTLNIHASSLEELLSSMDKLLKDLEARRKELGERGRSLGESIGSLEGLLRDTREKISLLSGSEADRCPLCGSPLTKEHKERVLRRLRREASEYEGKITVLREARSQIEEKIRSVENSIQAAASFRDRVRKLASDYVEEIGRIAREEEELVRRLREAKEKMREIEEERRRVEEALKVSRQAREDYELYRHLRESLRPGEPGSLEREIAGIESRLREINSEASRLKRGLLILLGTPISDENIGSLVEKAGKAYARLRELEGIKHRREELLNTMEKIREREEEARHHLGMLEEEKSGILSEGYSEEAYRKAGEEVQSLQKRVGEAEATLNSLKKMLRDLDSQEREERERERKLLEDEKRVEEAGFKLRVLTYIREKIFHRDYAPSIIREHKLREVEDIMRDLLDKFNLAYSDVRVGRDFTITLLAPNGVYRAVDMLSGGEKVSASIAALLALHQVAMRGRLGFLVMDEPTIHLDAERRRHLIELLRRFRGGGIIPQLIIVTHDEDIRDASDHVYEVRATTRGSMVELVGEEPFAAPRNIKANIARGE